MHWFRRNLEWLLLSMAGVVLSFAGYAVAGMDGVRPEVTPQVEAGTWRLPAPYRLNKEGRLESLSYHDEAGYEHIWWFADGGVALREDCFAPWGSAYYVREWDVDGDVKSQMVHHSLVVADCSRGEVDLAAFGPGAIDSLEGLYLKGNTNVAIEDMFELKLCPNLKWVNVKQTLLNPDELQELWARQGAPIKVVH